jgi:hypothetical protein
LAAVELAEPPEILKQIGVPWKLFLMSLTTWFASSSTRRGKSLQCESALVILLGTSLTALRAFPVEHQHALA